MARRHKAFVAIAGTVCLVSVLVQVSIWLRHPRWFRGNLHAHSSRIDGDSPPVDVARWYRDHGYHFVALSDLSKADRGAVSNVASDRFLVLDATEPNGQSGSHVNGIGIRQAPLARDGLTRGSSLFDNVESVREAGGIPNLSHPRRNKLTFTDLMHLDGELLLDINEGVHESEAPSAGLSPQKMWDELLSAGKTVYGVASDDARYFKSEIPRAREIPGAGWIVVRTDAFDRDAILSAIRKGEFYPSTGVALHDVRWRGGDLRVSIAGDVGGRYRTTFLGPQARVLSVSITNPAVYRPSAGDGYIRAHIEDQQGHSAWTQAVGVPEQEREDEKKRAVDFALSRQIALSLDAAPMEGPVMPVPPFDGSGVGCGDKPPGNNADFGERVLSARRAIREGAYEHAKARWILTQMPSADLETIAQQVRARYRSTVERNLAERTLTGVQVRPIVLAYPAGYAGNAATVHVRVKIITLETIDTPGRRRRLTTYYVNYDRAGEQEVVLVSVPQVPAEAMLGLRVESGFTGTAGRLAVSGLPLLLYDPAGTGASFRPEAWEHGLYVQAADLRLIDAELLERFTRVDLLGSTGTLVHLLVSHRSHIASAYLGGFIPLWTRNDAPVRTGGPFGTDEDTDHLVYQTGFQWSDFLLGGIRDGIHLGLASDVGASGWGKAGLFFEIVPTLRRFTSAVEIRGDDPDGDGFSQGIPVCAGFDVKDVQDFLRRERR